MGVREDEDSDSRQQWGRKSNFHGGDMIVGGRGNGVRQNWWVVAQPGGLGTRVHQSER